MDMFMNKALVHEQGVPRTTTRTRTSAKTTRITSGSQGPSEPYTTPKRWLLIGVALMVLEVILVVLEVVLVVLVLVLGVPCL